MISIDWFFQCLKNCFLGGLLWGALSFLSGDALAYDYFWDTQDSKDPSPYVACDNYMVSTVDLRNRLWPYEANILKSVWLQRVLPKYGHCLALIDSANGPWTLELESEFLGDCPKDRHLDADTGACIKSTVSPKQKGNPPQTSCSVAAPNGVSPVAGNPINFSVGNKFQAEVDYQSNSSPDLLFMRTYNSADGLWRHNYSMHIRVATDSIAVVRSDGRENYFSLNNSIATPYPDEFGKMVASGSNWIYTSLENQTYTFDSSGRLVQSVSPAGVIVTLSYGAAAVVVADNLGHSLAFTQDGFYQPVSLTAGSTIVAYGYDANSHLTKVSVKNGEVTSERQYLYEDLRDSSLLTGIIDARGVRFATWAYDDQGRAISSTHAGDAGKVSIVYNADGSTTVTNELGRSTVYSFATLNDVKLITSIDGEPAPGCPASNSTYTYNSAGQVLTKTDAKGMITQYTYNDRGLETQRIEGAGSAQPRTTTTEWDPSRFLRTKVVDPSNTTVYTYDAQGRQLTQVTTPNSSQ